MKVHDNASEIFLFVFVVVVCSTVQLLQLVCQSIGLAWPTNKLRRRVWR